MKNGLCLILVICICFLASACTQECDESSLSESVHATENPVESSSGDTEESVAEKLPYETLYLSQFQAFEIGQTKQKEIYETVGEPHDYWGYGYIRDVYYTEDGYSVSLTYQMSGEELVLESMEIGERP